MNFLKRYKVEIAVLALISVAFFFSRLYNLMSLPLFTDEAIYVRWSQIARYDPAWRFISLTDGKQPSFVWITMTLMKFIEDPLMAGRLVSVGAGFFTLIGMFFLGKEIFKNRWVGIISSALYLIFPMALVYDRMALYDSLVGTFSVWSLYLEVLLIRRVRLDVALLLAMVIGGGVLTKTSAFFSIYLLPFSLVLFDIKQKEKINRFFKWAALAILAAVLAYGYYSILRLFPLFHIIAEKNSVFVYPLHDWITHPFNFFMGNFSGLNDWYQHYISLPIIGLVIFSYFIYLKYTREKVLLAVWFLLPFIALALFGRVLYPRFIFFMALATLPLAALSLYRFSEVFKNKLTYAFCFLLFALISLKADYYILTDFKNAPIPRSDLGQYINGWPAGGGIKEMITFLEEQAKQKKIYVATDGTFGSLPTYAVEIYLGDNKNVEKRGIWPLPEELPEDLIKKSKIMPVYFILNQAQIVPPKWPVKLVAQYQKGTKKIYLFIYEVVK